MLALLVCPTPMTNMAVIVQEVQSFASVRGC
jgi:hypothetical protein